MSPDHRIRRPGPLILASFGAAILLGGLLLSLPISHRATEDAVSFSDAAYTAASAVTVTGLVVNDTGAVWSPFGEVVILVLIQIGGLGIMTLAGFLGITLNQRLGLRRKLLVGTEIGVTNHGELRNLLGHIVRFVLGIEVTAAVLLTVRFVTEGMGLQRAAHLGIFHSVSAFNNAGFSILPNGLEPYVGDWFVNLVIIAAFVLGGIGFPVVFEVAALWRKPKRWSLHTKITLSMTVLLLAAGSIAIGAVEWTNDATFGGLAFDEKVLASFFQSATARTAGFNTVPIGALRPASWMVLILLMVIGAGSASTGGGIKTSTFALVVRSTLAEFRGDQTTHMFDRTVPVVLQRQALSLVVGALGTVGTATFLLSVTNRTIPLSELLFEAASAFGTVGISTGITDDLDSVGRLVVMMLMFIGRVGPITFGTAVLLRPERKRFGYAEEVILIG